MRNMLKYYKIGKRGEKWNMKIIACIPLERIDN